VTGAAAGPAGPAASPAAILLHGFQDTISMHFSRLLLVPVAALSLAACSDDDGVTVSGRPPLGGVRIVNAVPDMIPMDVRMVDQVEWSANSTTTSANYGLPYRVGTIHWATEAKARHIRVFPTDSNIAVTSRILLDTTITIEANKNVTLMLVPGVRAGAPNAQSETDSVAIIVVDDTPPTLTGNQIAVRAVNAGIAGGIAAYLTPTATTALAAPATWTIADRFGAGSPYVVRDTGTYAVRAAAAATPLTATASAAAPAGAPQDGLIGATGGFRGAGSAISAYVFPRACPAQALPTTATNCRALRGQSAAIVTASQAASIVHFIDKIPAPPVQTSTPPTTP
jgi:hypothetical protein